MPKVIESKIVVTADTRDAETKLDRLNRKASQSVTEGMGGGREGIGPSGKVRSDLEWASFDSRMRERQRIADERRARRPLPEGIVRLREGERWKPPTTTAPPPPSDEERRTRRGFGRTMRGVGGYMGAGGAVLGATQGAMTPAVGGMLTAAGGAMSSAFGGFGAVAGLPMMAAGTLLGLQWMTAQTAMTHYGALAPSYRMLGNDRALRAKKIGEGTWTPDEAIRISRQLNRVGAYEAFGTMTKMRFGGYEQEMMQPFFETAMRTGAAGKGTQQDFDRLGKIVVAAFDKNNNLVSMEQSIETMVGLMGQSSNYLADISDDQSKELARITAWGQASGTSILRGQRGVETIGRIQNWVARPGEPGSEMFMWHALGAQGMNYLQFRKLREDPKAIMPVLGELAGLGDMGTLMLSKATGISVTQAEAVMEAKRAGLGDKEVTRRLESAEKENIDFKSQGTMADLNTTMKSFLEFEKLRISEPQMKRAMDLEIEFLKTAADALDSKALQWSMDQVTLGLKELAKYLRGDEKPPKLGGGPDDPVMNFLIKANKFFGGEPTTKATISPKTNH